MDFAPTPSGPDVDRLRVPEELAKQVHEARERFRISKENLEKAMEDTEYDHGQHVEERIEDLRKAERELESLTEKVQEILGRKA
jgi:protein-arginine kinase activator protein McsA